MKIYLSKNEVLEILAKHFDMLTDTIDTPKLAKGKKVYLVCDSLYWEGNEEKA